MQITETIKRAYQLYLLLATEVQEIHDIRADLENFDGDRRGHLAALEEAEQKAINTLLIIFPDKYKEEASE